jgi:hypothetical protein
MSAPAAPTTTLEDLLDALAARRIARMPPTAWAQVAATFPETERHATGVAGALLIIRTPAGPAAVETPSDQEVVVRPLAEAEVRRFVTDRLAQYERMWEGCGCRIDYYR